MGRKGIWELSCFGLDAVRFTSFDPDELRTLDDSMRERCDIPDPEKHARRAFHVHVRS